MAAKAEIESARKANKLEAERTTKVEADRNAKIESARKANKLEAERTTKVEADRNAKSEAERMVKVPSVSECWIDDDADESQGLAMTMVDKLWRLVLVLNHGRRYLNFALVIAGVMRRRFSGAWRWRIRQPDQLS